jgi:hypothetical protein
VRPAASVAARLSALALLAAATAVGFWPFRMPPSVPADAPATVFSAARAWRTLEVIAAAPRPVGSVRHAEVRDYLKGQLEALGLECHIQTAQVFSPERGHPFPAAQVENVVARLPGHDGGRALLLVAHYDSVPTGPGASDNGAAVAALLETARALRAGPKLANDVLFLFSDAEEERLLGAMAFQQSHPWARQVELVINFDARGTGGPALMFETGEGNGWLVRQLGATPHPVANSLSYEFYKLMPNDTDFTVFRQAGLPGLNFGNIGDGLPYHTMLEDLEHAQPETLQHQGKLLLSLARRLGDADLSRVREEDAVYFNLGPLLVQYPARWAPLLLLPVVGALGAAGVRAARRGRLRAPGLIRSLLGLVLSGAVACGLTWLAWTAALAAVPELRSLPEGQTYLDGPLVLGLTLLPLSTLAGALALLRRHVNPSEFAAAGALLWLGPAVLTSLLLPGGSYLFVWPLLGLAAALWISAELPPHGASAGQLVALGLAATPGPVLVAPLILTVFEALTLSYGFLITALTALLLTSGAALLRSMLERGLPLVAAVALVLGLTLVSVGAALGARFDAHHPRPNSLVYLLDGDSGTALRLSSDAIPDGWLSAVLGPASTLQRLDAPFPGWRRDVWTAPAPALELPLPSATVVRDAERDGLRELTLNLASHRDAPFLELQVDPSTPLLDLEVAGKALTAEQLQQARSAWGGPRIQFWAAPREGIHVTLRLPAHHPLRLRVSDHTFHLPAQVGMAPGRPEGSMQVPFGDGISEGTRITRTQEF